MAYKVFDGLSQGTDSHHAPTTLHIDGQTVELPDSALVRDADMTRDGMDLVLQSPHGSVVVENYFATEPAPNLVAPDGSTLTPGLVNSFVHSDTQFASAGSATDESPVGSVQEVSGEATVQHVDGTSEPLSAGTKIYLGDIIETGDHGAVNIAFNDETTFAVSEDARLSIDDYVYHPETQSGETNFSVLKGLFVFTSGLIGRDDPDHVHINTPVGSIGIRGTIIAGNVNSGEITVVEGAIVLHDLQGNEMTLASEYETAKFELNGDGISHVGQLSAQDVADRFTGVSDVAPTLFSSINDSAIHQGGTVQDEIQLNVPADAPQDAPADDTGTLPADDGTTTDGIDPKIDSQLAPEGETQVVNTTDGMLPPPPLGTTDSGFGTNTSGFTTDSKLVGLAPLSTTTQTLQPLPPPPVNTTSADGTITTTTTIATTTSTTTTSTTSLPPPFGISFQTFAFNENTSNAVVAHLSGMNGVIGSAADIHLNGPLAGYFDIINTGPNNFDLRLKSGILMDYDLLKSAGIASAVGFHVVSTTGTASDGVMPLQLLNVNEAPLFEQHLASSSPYLAAAEGSVWMYHFNKEFVNPDYNDPLHYQLSTATISALDTWGTTGTLLGTQGTGWTFDQNTGQLQLFFNGSFGFTPGGTQALAISVEANDGVNSAGYHTYNFAAFNDNNTALPSILLSSNPNTVFKDGNADTTLTIGSSGIVTGKTIFMEGGNDTVTLNESQGNTVNLGDGNNHLYITSFASNTGNIVVGGNNQDTFDIQNAGNKVYGMDGDDDFILHLADNVAGFLQTNSGLGSVRFDGGWSNFRAADRLNDGDLLGYKSPVAASGGGRGDSIILDGAGNINFTLIDNNYFKDFERIDAQNGATNTVTLNYTDVVQMTNQNNALIINMDNNDTLSFNNEGHSFTKVGTNVAIDDARQGEASDVQNYDVYTDGNVTLLVHQDTGATVTGLPA